MIALENELPGVLYAEVVSFIIIAVVGLPIGKFQTGYKKLGDEIVDIRKSKVVFAAGPVNQITITRIIESAAGIKGPFLRRFVSNLGPSAYRLNLLAGCGVDSLADTAKV